MICKVFLVLFAHVVLAVLAVPQTQRFTLKNVPEDVFRSVFQGRQSIGESARMAADRQEDRTHPGPQGYSFDPCTDDSDCLNTHTPRTCRKASLAPCAGTPNCLCIPDSLEFCTDCTQCPDAPDETCGTYTGAASTGDGYCVSNYTIYEGILVEVGCDSFPWVTPLPPLPTFSASFSFDFNPSMSGMPSSSLDVPVGATDEPVLSPGFATPAPSLLAATSDAEPSESSFPTVLPEATTPPQLTPMASGGPVTTPDIFVPPPQVVTTPQAVTSGYTFDSCESDSDCVSPRTCRDSSLKERCGTKSDCVCADSHLEYCTSCDACEAYPQETCVELVSSLTVGVCVSSTLLKLGVKEIGCEQLFPSVGASESMEASMEPTESGGPSFITPSESVAPTMTPLTRDAVLSMGRNLRSLDYWVGKLKKRNVKGERANVAPVWDEDIEGFANVIKELRKTHRLT